jgi:hypothetical protein
MDNNDNHNKISNEMKQHCDNKGKLKVANKLSCRKSVLKK